MQVKAGSSPPLDSDADTIAVGVFEGGGAPEGAAEGAPAPPDTGRKLGRVTAVQDRGRWLLQCGLGPRERFGAEEARVAAAAADARANEISTRVLCWALPESGSPARVAAGLVEGTLLHAYRFDRYRPASSDPALEVLIVSGPDAVADAVARAGVVTEAQNRARALGDTPANDLPPRALAEYATELASRHSRVSTAVMDGDAIREAGMGAFAAVAQGSAEDARLIRLEYEPAAAGGPHLGFVGKAVTFDSGGLSLKRADDMHEMKFDMCGGAAVLEAISALASLEAPVRVTGIVGATENLPSGRAVKPGDIVRALDGTTIEINNTDAEGRLVLADCLTYARRLGCERLIDLATLTGGVVTALGWVYAGLMSNDSDWSELVRRCGAASGDRVWPLPLDERYAEMIEGDYAQLTNRAERRVAQPITAAELLHHFVGDVAWAHIDIAGTAWDVPRPYYVGKGATGFGVRLLVEVARAAG